MQDTPLQWMVQAGGLGLAAYLVWWMTRSLNGKFDRLTEAVRELTQVMADHNTKVRR